MTGPGTATVEDLDGELRRYYESRTVRERMEEFLAGPMPGGPSAMYITATDGRSSYTHPVAPSRLPQYLDAGVEVDRSLWDRDSLIADIDLEYQNFDDPSEPWLHPERVFRLQQPVLEATLQVLGEAGIKPLVLLSGRGYHLVWAIRRESRAFRHLTELPGCEAGGLPPSLRARYARAGVDPLTARAFAGLGLIIEFVAHRVLRICERSCALPVQATAIEVGPGMHGREIVSFDLSEYGDPLHARHIRLPFSAYLKPRQFEWLLGETGARRLLPIFEIPLCEMTLSDALAIARDPRAAAKLSRHVSTAIPHAWEPMECLLKQYRASELASFHAGFYRQLRSHGSFCANLARLRVPQTPPCLRWPLEQPNDTLLKPAALQHVARMLTALGWSPVSIAELIYASYRRDCGWGDIWKRLDPAQRAVFYTRLFTGLIATGIDKLVDMNCVSHQEKGFCGIEECYSNLAVYRDSLLQKRAV